MPFGGWKKPWHSLKEKMSSHKSTPESSLLHRFPALLDTINLQPVNKLTVALLHRLLLTSFIYVRQHSYSLSYLPSCITDSAEEMCVLLFWSHLQSCFPWLDVQFFLQPKLGQDFQDFAASETAARSLTALLISTLASERRNQRAKPPATIFD